MLLTNKVYDALKWFVQMALPAIGALYFGLSQIWPLPYAEQVVGTCTIAALFLGTLIGISKSTYEKKGEFDGTIDIDMSDPDLETYFLNLSIPPESIVDKKVITFSVNPTNTQRTDTR